MTTRPSHLDEDQLWAALDGELDPEAAEHGDTCDECRARLAHWRRVVGLVAVVPFRPSDDQVEEAVRTALTDGFGLQPGRPSAGQVPGATGGSMAGAAAGATGGSMAGAAAGATGGSMAGAAAGATGGSMAGAAAGGSPTPMAARRRLVSGSLRVRIAAAVAAALIVAGVVAAVASHHGGSGQAKATATGSAAASPTWAASSAGAASGTHGAISAPPGGAERVPLPSALPSPGPSLPNFESPGALVAALRAELNAVPAPGNPRIASSPAVETCVVPAAGAAGVPAGTGLVFEATVTYRGSPAEVYVFSLNNRHRAAVVHPSGCQALAVVSF